VTGKAAKDRRRHEWEQATQGRYPRNAPPNDGLFDQRSAFRQAWRVVAIGDMMVLSNNTATAVAVPSNNICSTDTAQIANFDCC
jgi:hypothetical protein